MKQCRDLARHGYQVSLIVADGLGNGRADGIDILDVGREHGRMARMLHSTGRVYRRARALDAAIYHLHDPELIPAGLRLKQLGKTVIFDAHEDLPLQLLGKPYLHPAARRQLSRRAGTREPQQCRRLDGIVAATPAIGAKFAKINRRTIEVANYPVQAEFDRAQPWDRKAREVCYVGSIAAMRGVRELVAACELMRSGVRLNLAGLFEDPALAAQLSAQPGWSRVNWLGQLDRAGVSTTLRRSLAGLVTLHPQPNYLDALPVKMFEYMAAGIPVIASTIPMWRAIVEEHQCGLCVDPHDPAAIAAAIDYLAGHPKVAARMGANGRRAIDERYNWSVESAKLLALYEGFTP